MTGRVGPSPRQRTRARLEVCASCPFLDGKGQFRRCTKCGCLIGAKALVRSFQCPEGKWPA